MTAPSQREPPEEPAPDELEQLKQREQLERRRQMRGLLWLAVIAVGFSIWRAGAGRVFPHGWWRLW